MTSPAHSLATHSLDAVLDATHEQWREAGLERLLRPVHGRRGPIVMAGDRALVDFASNDYLGLASHPRVAAAASAALEREGTGAAAARLIAGDHTEHEALELELARFFDTPAALVFSSGYAANVGAIPALVGRGDAIFSDARNHASLIDGIRLSRATVFVYDHASPTALEALLNRERASHRRALIVTDGTFSMDGDAAPLPEITSLAGRFDAWTYVDDAHGLGVLGSSGGGVAELADVRSRIDILVGTLGKAFGSAGAFVLGSAALRRHLINHARSFVFSTAMPPAQAAASRESLRVVREEPELAARLRATAATLRAALGVPLSPLGINHIVPVIVGDATRAMRIGAALADRGYLVGAVRPPTVAPGTARLRVTASAAHTAQHIEGFAKAFHEICSEHE